MRTLILAITAAALATTASAQQIHTRMRDCLRGVESGAPTPTSSRPNAKWLFITNVMMHRDDTKEYGANTSWKVAGSLKQACDAALADFPKEPKNKGYTITGIVAELVPDAVMQQARH